MSKRVFHKSYPVDTPVGIRLLNRRHFSSGYGMIYSIPLYFPKLFLKGLMPFSFFLDAFLIPDPL